jgi:hypothetical protein
VPQELVAVLDLVVKTSCPSCPISDPLPTVIVEDKVRVPAFLKRFKEEEKHEELHRHVALAQNEGNTYPADNS